MATHRTEVRVRYADTDRGGVVYHSEYLVFLEVGRTEMMRALGCPYRELENEGFVMPVVDLSMKYRAPARYDDLLVVESRLTEVDRVRVRIDSRVLLAETGAVLAEGWLRLACVGPEGRPKALPAEARRLMSADISGKADPW